MPTAMHCSSCGASVSSQGGQQSASMGKNGGSISEQKFVGVSVSIRQEIKAFFNEQYKAIKHPEAGTTAVRLKLNSYTISLLNEGQTTPCQLSVVYQSVNKTSAGSPPAVVPTKTEKEGLPKNIQLAIEAFIKGVYKSIGDSSGTSSTRHLLANWVNEILNEDQASTCWMKLAVGPDTQTSRYVYDQNYLSYITRERTNIDLPIQQTGTGINAPCQEEFVYIPAKSSSGATDVVSGFADAACCEGEEHQCIGKKPDNTPDRKPATASDPFHDEEEGQCVEVKDKCVVTSDSKSGKVSDTPGKIQRSTSVDECYGSMEASSKAPVIAGLQIAQQEPGKLELDTSS